MIYAVACALLIGLSLGVFGSGGSILTVPILVYLLGHEDKVAIAESLAIVGVVALVGGIGPARAGLVSVRTVLSFGAPGMLGALGGAWGAAFVPGAAQLLAFSVVMLWAGVMMWRRASGAGESEGGGRGTRSIAWFAACGLGVGVVTGFVGVGGGFLIVPALVLLTGMPMRRAVGNSLFIISMNCVVGFLKHTMVLREASIAPDWSTIAVFAVVGSTGGLAGAALQAKIGQRALRRGFAVFLLLMGVFILMRESGAVLGERGGTAPASEPAG
jgi:uncharacterized membrane protein YfcA